MQVCYVKTDGNVSHVWKVFHVGYLVSFGRLPSCNSTMVMTQVPVEVVLIPPLTINFPA